MSNTPLTSAHLTAFSQLPSDIILSTLHRLRAVSPIAPLVESPRSSGVSPRSHNRPWELSPRSRGTSPSTSPRDAAAAYALASSTHKFAIPSPRGPACEAVDYNVPCGRRSPPSEGTPAASKVAQTSPTQQPVYAPVPVLIPSTAAQYQHLLNAYAMAASEGSARAVRMPANYVSQALLLQAAAQLNQLSSQPQAQSSNVRAETGKRKRGSKKPVHEAAQRNEQEEEEIPSNGEKETDDDDDDESAKKKKRANPDQVQLLEEVFLREPLPSRRTKEQLATRLGLSHRRVQVWFQNRRAKERRHLRNKGINDAEVLPNPWAK